MYIDISYPLSTEMAIYPGNPYFEMKKVQDIEAGDAATVSRLVMGSHTGTHIDAPSHFIKGGKTIDQIPLEQMNGRAKVLDLTGYTDIDAPALRERGIGNGDIVLLKTDNSYSWHCDRILEDYVTLTYDAAELLARIEVKLVGIDYLTVERPRKKREQRKSVHEILLGSDILICEALNLKDVPEGEYGFYCLPLKIEGADGCPVRIVIERK